MKVRPAAPLGLSTDIEQRAAFALDVEYYLSQDPRQLPSRYLYDELGSSLFEAICRLPWYAITRAETRLLTTHWNDILRLVDPISRIVELGSGSGEKLATLLAGRQPSAPLEVHLIDLSPAALAQSVRTLAGLSGIQVVTHEATYEAGLADSRRSGAGDATLVLFLGSNIGNFDPPGAHEFVREIRATVSTGDYFLLGADLVKPEAVLQLAYDDPLQVTAAFNRNLLVRINRELGGTFDLDSFAHEARWNAAASRIEMHLVSRTRQLVTIDDVGLAFTFEAGESIWTESSYKYEPSQIVDLVERAGFAHVAQWIDSGDRFALTLFTAA